MNAPDRSPRFMRAIGLSRLPLFLFLAAALVVTPLPARANPLAPLLAMLGLGGEEPEETGEPPPYEGEVGTYALDTTVVTLRRRGDDPSPTISLDVLVELKGPESEELLTNHEPRLANDVVLFIRKQAPERFSDSLALGELAIDLQAIIEEYIDPDLILDVKVKLAE